MQETARIVCVGYGEMEIRNILNKKNKSGQGLPTSTLVLMVIGILVLVLVGGGFALGWDYIFDKMGLLPDDLTAATQACIQYAGTDSLKISYCQYRELRIEGKKRWVNCNHVHDFAEAVLGQGKAGFDTQTCGTSEVEYCNQLKAKDGFKDSVLVNKQTCEELGIAMEESGTGTSVADSTSTGSSSGESIDIQNLEAPELEEDENVILLSVAESGLEKTESISEIEILKENLGIPEEFCYWDEMKKMYMEKCSLREEQVVEIFEKKKQYRKSTLPDWAVLNTDGDYCVPVIFDPQLWGESGGESLGAAGFWNFKAIYINPHLKWTKEKVDNLLYHEGLHSIQYKLSDKTHIFNSGSWNSFSAVSMALNKVESAKIIEDNIEKIEGIGEEFYNKLDKVMEDIIDEKLFIQFKESKTPEEVERLKELGEIEKEIGTILINIENVDLLFTTVYTAQGVEDYEKAYSFLNLYYKSYKYIEVSEEQKTNIDAFKNVLYKAYLVCNEAKVKDYLSLKQELDPRLSEVQRWWIDKTAPNCGIIETQERAREVLNLFLEDANPGQYYQTQVELKTLINLYKEEGKEEELYDLWVTRLPGIAQITDSPYSGIGGELA